MCNILLMQEYLQTHVNNILEVLPEFVGESYDEAAWRDCLTMLVRRITHSGRDVTTTSNQNFTPE